MRPQRVLSFALMALAAAVGLLAAPSRVGQLVETSGPASPAPSLDAAPTSPSAPPPSPPTTAAEPDPAREAVDAIGRMEGLDAPDPFAVMDHGRPYLFTTNTVAGNIPVITPGVGGTPTTVDALPVLPDWAAPGFTWAPAVIAEDGRWVLAFTARHRASGRQCIGVATGSVVTGPYQPEPDPLVCDLARGGSIDPSFVVDDAGNRWLLYKDDGNCCGLPTTLRAAPLTADGTALAGVGVALLHADRPWEDGVVEAPTMMRVGDRWLLLYSASRWDHAGYAVGAAWCDTPLGPCRKQPEPLLSVGEGYDGPGGLEFVATTGTAGTAADAGVKPLASALVRARLEEGIPVVFHAWPDTAHGYDDGGQRELHLGVVVARGDQLLIATRR